MKNGSREDAIWALINMWLKDPRKKCGWCGKQFNRLEFPCCEQPFIATNFDILEQFYYENKESRKLLRSEFGETKGKHMRVKLSMPPSLLQFLTKSFLTLYNEELFNKKYGTTWFARKFKNCFAVPERI